MQLNPDKKLREHTTAQKHEWFKRLVCCARKEMSYILQHKSEDVGVEKKMAGSATNESYCKKTISFTNPNHRLDGNKGSFRSHRKNMHELKNRTLLSLTAIPRWGMIEFLTTFSNRKNLQEGRATWRRGSPS